MTDFEPSSASPPPDEASDVRVGSPFADHPADAATAPARDPVAGDHPTDAAEALWHVGPIGYTALGAVFAAAIASVFAAVAAWYFPSGAIAVAALGCGLALFGLGSPRRIAAAVFVLVNLGLFLLSIARVIA